MPLDPTSPADSDLISLGAGEMRQLKTDIQAYFDEISVRKPVLVWVSATQVDIENNTGTEHQTTIPFRDGDVRSVTENTGSTTKYRRFDITSTAEFSSGTEESGLRSGLSEASNTWYAIYAVKSTVDDTKFVLAGDTTFPTQANISTLNSRYGDEGWVYLGEIRNGDNSANGSDILYFVQDGNTFILSNEVDAGEVSGGLACFGIRMADTSGAVALAYSYSSGSGATNIPATIKFAYYSGIFDNTAGRKIMYDSAQSRHYAMTTDASANNCIFSVWRNAVDGASVANTAGSSAMSIMLVGWTDGYLS